MAAEAVALTNTHGYVRRCTVLSDQQLNFGAMLGVKGIRPFQLRADCAEYQFPDGSEVGKPPVAEQALKQLLYDRGVLLRTMVDWDKYGRACDRLLRWSKDKSEYQPQRAPPSRPAQKSFGGGSHTVEQDDRLLVVLTGAKGRAARAKGRCLNALSNPGAVLRVKGVQSRTLPSGVPEIELPPAQPVEPRVLDFVLGSRVENMYMVVVDDEQTYKHGPYAPFPRKRPRNSSGPTAVSPAEVTYAPPYAYTPGPASSGSSPPPHAEGSLSTATAVQPAVVSDDAKPELPCARVQRRAGSSAVSSRASADRTNDDQTVDAEQCELQAAEPVTLDLQKMNIASQPPQQMELQQQDFQQQHFQQQKLQQQHQQQQQSQPRQQLQQEQHQHCYSASGVTPPWMHFADQLAKFQKSVPPFERAQNTLQSLAHVIRKRHQDELA